MEKGIEAYQVIDHGVEHSQYFQGCGVAFTEFVDCFTGIGDTAREALDDAIENAAMAGYSVESLEGELKGMDNLESVSETLLKEIETEWIDRIERECRDYAFGIHPGESYSCPDCIKMAGYSLGDFESRIEEEIEEENPDMDYQDVLDLAEKRAEKEFPVYLKEQWEKGEFVIEGSFSPSSCELCGSRLGGDRYPAHGVNDDGEIIHYDICSDCLFYLANGELPDFSETSEFQKSEVYHYVSILVR